jgi:hypothetical protein
MAANHLTPPRPRRPAQVRLFFGCTTPPAVCLVEELLPLTLDMLAYGAPTTPPDSSSAQQPSSGTTTGSGSSGTPSSSVAKRPKMTASAAAVASRLRGAIIGSTEAPACAGGTVAAIPATLPLPLVLRIAMDVARGLAQLHPGMVHRDLKPANILLAEDGTAKISDLWVEQGGPWGTCWDQLGWVISVWAAA